MPDTQQPSVSNATESNKDLVIRNGFPALRLKDGSPNIQDSEALPRHPIWASQTGWPVTQLRADAETVFTARTRDDGASYSAGITYFLPCRMKPRCALEGLVQTIFRVHTDAIQSTFVDEISGAEWWTLVMDSEDEPRIANAADEDLGDDDDEVGMHFDADYGLEAQAPGLLLHPRLATITYLSDFGAPTVVWDRPSPPPDKIDEMAGNVQCAWLSHPKTGKHLAFDGRLLHGAPTVFFPAKTTTTTDHPTKRPKLDQRRITLLVNIWLNHCPLDAEPLDSEIIPTLTAPWDPSEPTSVSTQPLLVEPNAESLAKPPDTIVHATVKVAEKSEEEAGSEEFVVCNRIVCAEYRASMEALHAASNAGDLVEVSFEEGAFTLAIGGAVEDDANHSEKTE